MAEHLRMILLVAVSVLMMVMSIDISQYSRSTKYLKEDLEVAVHDAALQIDPLALAEGQIVFDEEKARETFIETLEINTGLTLDDYNIIDFEFFDHGNSVFPVTFESEHTRFSDMFFYPTIVVIIETETNKFFSFTHNSRDVRQVASYTYHLP